MRHRALSTRIAFFVPFAFAIVIAASLPLSAAGQTDSSTPAAAPPGAEVPGLLACDATPYFGFATTMPYVGDQVAWRAAGLQAGSQVSIVVTDLLNPQFTMHVAAVGNGWCQASGTIALPRPVLYKVDLVGTASTTGDSVDLTAWPFPVIPPAPTPSPTPLPTPAAPTVLRASQVNSNTARLDWTDNAANASSLMISTGTGELPVQPRMTTMNVGGLSPNQVYCFTIFAVNSAGRSSGGGDCLTMKSMR